MGCLVNMTGGTDYAYRTLVVLWETSNFSELSLMCTWRWNTWASSRVPFKKAYINESKSCMLCHLTLSEVFAESIWIFTVAWVKSLTGTDLEVTILLFVAEQLRQIITWLTLLRYDKAFRNLPGLAKQKYFCFAFVWLEESQHLDGMTLWTWWLESKWTTSMTWTAISNYTSVEWLPTCCKLQTNTLRTEDHLNESGVETMA